MKQDFVRLRRIARVAAFGSIAALVSACGGSGGSDESEMDADAEALAMEAAATQEALQPIAASLAAIDSERGKVAATGDRSATAFASRCSAISAIAATPSLQASGVVVNADATNPKHCRIDGRILDRAGFQVRVPAEWNGRFLMSGTGGLVGFVSQATGGGKLAVGWAVATSDSGHTGAARPELGNAPSLDGSWALDNPVAERDFADRAILMTTRVGKALSAYLQLSPPARSYMSGCSQGGRQALIAAERYPSEFDGFAAGAPGWNAVAGLFASWNLTAKLYTDTRFTPADIQLVQAGVLARCDAQDGVADGIVSDPERCDFDPATLQCPAGGTGCLSAAQVQTVRSTIDGLRDSAGNTLVNGFFATGTEAAQGSWPGTFAGGANPAEQTNSFLLQQEVYRYMVFTPDRPTFDYRTFDYVAERPNWASAAKLYDVQKKDFSSFARNGKRVIVTSGMADYMISPKEQIKFWQESRDASGAEAHDRFMRLYLAPGMQHCGGGSFSNFDALDAVVNWVETDQAPTTLAARTTSGAFAGRTRDLCPYPQRSIYRGQGDVASASSFECR